MFLSCTVCSLQPARLVVQRGGALQGEAPGYEHARAAEGRGRARLPGVGACRAAANQAQGQERLQGRELRMHAGSEQRRQEQRRQAPLRGF